jgi:transposase-like protein
VASWAAFDSRWWLVTVAAVAAGVGYAFGTLRWWHAYRHDPTAHAGGATPRVLAALALIACLGFVALLIAS